MILFSWQESHTANTAAFWRWSVLSSGYSPSRSSLQSTMAAGLAGRLWRGALVSGLWKLGLNGNLFIIKTVRSWPLCCSSVTWAKPINSQCFKCCTTMGNKHILTNLILLHLLKLLTSDCWAHNTSIQRRVRGCDEVGEHELHPWFKKRSSRRSCFCPQWPEQQQMAMSGILFCVNMIWGHTCVMSVSPRSIIHWNWTNWMRLLPAVATSTVTVFVNTIWQVLL